MKKRIVNFLFIISTLSLMACSNGEEVVKHEEPEEERQELDSQDEKEPEDEEVFYQEMFPLTGIGTNENVDHRAVAVSINNDPRARPQSGLHKSDLVYEVLAEGAITRFIAFYHSQKPEIVGPVRSARGYHIDLINGYDGFFITHGWSPEAQQMLANEGRADFLNGLYHDGTLFQRSTERRAPHNSYITYEDIETGLKNKAYNLTGSVDALSFYEGEQLEIEGKEAKELTIDYFNRYKVTYEYDAENSHYLRYNGDQQTIDLESETPVTIENLLIVEMDHQVVDNDGRRDIDTISGGKAMLIQGGTAQEVEWKNEGGRILPVKNDRVLKLIPGQTWINIIPTHPGLSESVRFES